MTDLVLYDSIKAALVKAQSFDELLTIKDAARRMEEAGRRSRDTSMIEAATELQVLYKRYLGKMLSEMPKAPAGRKANRSPTATDFSPGTLKEIGVSKNESSVAQKLYAVPEEKFGEVVAAAKAKDHKVSVAAVLRSINTKPKKTEKLPKANTDVDKDDITQVLKARISKLELENRQLLRGAEDRDNEMTLYSEALEADEKTAPLLKEIKDLKEEIRILRERNIGLQREKAEAVRQSELWRKRAGKK